MKTALIIMLLSVMAITACSSNNTPKTQYYLLHSPTKHASVGEATSTPELEKQGVVLVTLLELPDYLTQPNLVLQLSNHRLHYSNAHMWAEPLRIGIAQALTDDLNNIEKRFNFSTNEGLNTTAQASITVKITAFQPTHLSQVILVGSYTFQQTNVLSKASNISQANNFKFTIDLDDNGYAHAVEKMREIIPSLARKISEDISG